MVEEDTSKAPDSLVKLGMSLAELGQKLSKSDYGQYLLRVAREE